MARMATMTVEALHTAARRLLADGDVPLVLRPTREQQVLAWMKTAPRAAPQIAQLLGISREYATSLLVRMRAKGLIVAIGKVEGRRKPSLLCAINR